METRQVITPRPPAAVPAYGGDADANRFRVATPHWNATYKKVLAAGNYAQKFNIAVPTSLTRRLVYADIGCADGADDVGWCLGSVNFYLNGNVLTLPFDFNPGSTTQATEVGFHATSSSAATTPGNTLGVDLEGTARLFVPPWEIVIACSKIEIELRAGVANAVSNCYVILGCLSQGKDDAP